jgi:hypothetical protein
MYLHNLLELFIGGALFGSPELGVVPHPVVIFGVDLTNLKEMFLDEQNL